MRADPVPLPGRPSWTPWASGCCWASHQTPAAACGPCSRALWPLWWCPWWIGWSRACAQLSTGLQQITSIQFQFVRDAVKSNVGVTGAAESGRPASDVDPVAFHPLQEPLCRLRHVVRIIAEFHATGKAHHVHARIWKKKVKVNSFQWSFF